MITLFSRKFNIPVMIIYTGKPLNQQKIPINETFLREPGIGPKLVLSLCPRCEACPEHGRMGRMDPKQSQMSKILMFSLRDALR
jgi:hypothetical protein